MDKLERQRIYNKTHYANNSERRKELTLAAREVAKQYIIKYKKDHPCACGENHPAALQFHHVDRNTKSIEVSTALRRGWSIARIQLEIDKCVVMCANCHLKLHWNEKDALV